MDDLELTIESIIVYEDKGQNYEKIDSAERSASFTDILLKNNNDNNGSSNNEKDHEQINTYYKNEKNISSNVHPRLNMFKRSGLDAYQSSNQEERRRQILVEQKQRRQNQLDKNRFEKNETAAAVLENYPAQRNKWNKVNLLYKDQLMLSEWLEEIPYDFHTNWHWVVCPVGKRCLVVAVDGITSVFNKDGKLICRHSSYLPGGNRDSRSDKTIIDCIYNEELQTYFVLDCICWKSHQIIYTEAEFRFFWINCKLNETARLNETSTDLNPYPFFDLPRFYDCQPDTIYRQLKTSKFTFVIDGILFYHKEGHYMSGHTPLVAWLKVYMIPEILNIKVSDEILNTAPSDYMGAIKTIENSNNKLKRVKEYFENKSSKQMMTETTITTTTQTRASKITSTYNYEQNTSPSTNIYSLNKSINDLISDFTNKNTKHQKICMEDDQDDRTSLSAK